MEFDYGARWSAALHVPEFLWWHVGLGGEFRCSSANDYFHYSRLLKHADIVDRLTSGSFAEALKLRMLRLFNCVRLKEQFDNLQPCAAYERVLGFQGEPEWIGLGRPEDHHGFFRKWPALTPLPAEPNECFRKAEAVVELALMLRCKWARSADHQLDAKRPLLLRKYGKKGSR